MRRHRVVTGVLAGVLLLAGCGKDGDPSASSSSTGQDKSPLSEYMGSDITSSGGGFTISIGGDGEQPTEEQLAKQRRVEDLTARCMQDQGFRYIPVPPRANAKDKFAEAFKLPPKEFAEQYGYGISTMDFTKASSDDPNTAIRDGLSARARAAYDKALNGQAPQANASGGAKMTTNGSGGCRGKAVEQVYGSGRQRKAQDMRRFDSLFTDIEALRKRIRDDPKVVEAARAWSDCMADAQQTGLTKPDDARRKVSDRFSTLLGLRPGDKGGMQIGPDSLRNVDPDKLADVRRYELAVAKADYNCRQHGYDQTYKQVQYAAEREFIQDHKTILEQFKEFAGQAKGNR